MATVIAIDGPAGAGKGTLAKRLAARFGYAHLDTGSLYRAVGLKVLRSNQDPEDAVAATEAARALLPEDIETPEIRGDAAAQAASKVAAIESVRDALLDFQRDFAAKPPDAAPGAVLDGRDVGTVVCPDADVKFYLDASVEARAERRLGELQERGSDVIYAAVLRDMQERDARDQARTVAPLRPAEDAIVIDTSGMDADAVFDRALTILEDRQLGSDRT